jgi:hypothetical protein
MLLLLKINCIHWNKRLSEWHVFDFRRCPITPETLAASCRFHYASNAAQVQCFFFAA